MLSQSQFGAYATRREAMLKSTKFDGPSAPRISDAQNKFAANSSTSLPKPGFSS